MVCELTSDQIADEDGFDITPKNVAEQYGWDCYKGGIRVGKEQLEAKEADVRVSDLEEYKRDQARDKLIKQLHREIE
jgi:hypothetical protein